MIKSLNNSVSFSFQLLYTIFIFLRNVIVSIVMLVVGSIVKILASKTKPIAVLINFLVHLDLNIKFIFLRDNVDSPSLSSLILLVTVNVQAGIFPSAIFSNFAL